MRKFGVTLAGAATALVAAAVISYPVHAAIMANGSFPFAGPGGSATVNTGNIQTTTTTKTLTTPQTTGTPSVGSNLGVALGSTLTLSTLTIQVPAGVINPNLTVSVPTTVGGGGTLTFLFNLEELAAPIVAQTTTAAGTISLMFTGNLTGDTTGTFITGATATASLSETCTQTAGPPTNSISCSDTLATPSSIVIITTTPEPASLALLGSALIGFGWMNRRRKTV